MSRDKLEYSPSLVSACEELTGGGAGDAALYVLVLFFIKCATCREVRAVEAQLFIPEGCDFEDIVAFKGKHDIGEKIAAIVGALADANPSIKGVIDAANWSDCGLLGESEERCRKLTKLINSIEDLKLDGETQAAVGLLEELLVALSSRDPAQGTSSTPSTALDLLVSNDPSLAEDTGSLWMLQKADEISQQRQVARGETAHRVSALVRCTLRLFEKSRFDTDALSIVKPRTVSDKRRTSAATTAPITVDEMRAAALALLDLAAEHEECTGTLPLTSLGARLPIMNGTADHVVTLMTGLEARRAQDVDSVKTMTSLAPVVRRLLEVSKARDDQRARDRALIHSARVAATIERELAARGGWGGDLNEMATWQSIKGSIAGELSVLASELQGRQVSVDETAAMLAKVSVSPRVKGGLPGLAHTLVVGLAGPTATEGIAVLKDASETLPAMKPFPREAAERNRRLRQVRYALHCMQFDEPKRSRMTAVVHAFLLADVDLDPVVVSLDG